MFFNADECIEGTVDQVQSSEPNDDLRHAGN
jgi:hypothetical protein